MWNAIAKQIKNHPEWGVGSVSEFIRRSVAHEIEARTNMAERKVLEIQLRPISSREDSRRTDSGEPLD